MPAATIRVRGAKELEAAFLEMRREVLLGLRTEILSIAEKVKDDAHRRSNVDIGNMPDSPRWAEFRLGVTTTSHFGALAAIGLGAAATPMIYIAPKARRRGGSPRGNLAPLLQNVMQSAADAHEEELWAGIEALINSSSAKAGL